MLSFQQLSYFLHQISIFSILLPVLLGVVLGRRCSKVFKILIALLYITTAIQLGSTFIKNYYTTIPQKYNLFLYHLLLPIEGGLLIWMYTIKLSDFASAKLLKGLMIGFVIFSMANTIWLMESFDSLQKFWVNFRYIAQFNSYTQLLEDFLLVALAFAYLYKRMKNIQTGQVEKDAFLWFNIGVLIYFSSKFTLDILSNFLLIYSRKVREITWSIHDFTNIILHILYSLAIWKDSRE